MLYRQETKALKMSRALLKYSQYAEQEFERGNFFDAKYWCQKAIYAGNCCLGAMVGDKMGDYTTFYEKIKTKTCQQVELYKKIVNIIKENNLQDDRQMKL
ncbi:MAG: hypothetical protein E7378_03980 [Clostridiales bacterium]|nr:hypothetical protein [Clostridiales bacterium]